MKKSAANETAMRACVRVSAFMCGVCVPSVRVCVNSRNGVMFAIFHELALT